MTPATNATQPTTSLRTSTHSIRTQPAVRPDILLLLANLSRPHRPANASTHCREPALSDPTAATRQLAAVTRQPIVEAELPMLRRLHRLVVQVTEVTLAGQVPPYTAINAIARGSTAHVELVSAEGTRSQHLVWKDSSTASYLARLLLAELAALEPARLGRCAHPECALLFYDTTRSRTKRWHAEDPCGWRGRQQHGHRSRG